jgi:cupin 2 domain-containing protein
MLPHPANLFAPSHAAAAAAEQFDVLYEQDAVRVERIVSHAQASPPGFWYDQDHEEWVTLLRGTATLRFEEGTVDFRAGDHLRIPAHLRHRVERTSADAVWLAVHVGSTAK